MATSHSSVRARPSVSTSLIATFAPERASSMASAWPIPELAPVTTATFPANPCMNTLPRWCDSELPQSTKDLRERDVRGHPLSQAPLQHAEVGQNQVAQSAITEFRDLVND